VAARCCPGIWSVCFGWVLLARSDERDYVIPD